MCDLPSSYDEDDPEAQRRHFEKYKDFYEDVTTTEEEDPAVLAKIEE